MRVKVENLAAKLVKLHTAIYFAIGVLLSILFSFGLSVSAKESLFLLENVATPIAFYACLQHYICSYFYQNKYEIVVPRNPLSRISTGIPNSDKYFIETISAEIDLYRKIAGYVYAFSKPIVFLAIGTVPVFLLIAMVG